MIPMMRTLVVVMLTLFLCPLSSNASSYVGTLSEPQKVVAEAWRLVDYSFLDRTFNHQDWFGLRQKYVRQTQYNDMEEAHTAIDAMLQTLGDKYTRYLPPSKYQSLVDSATGTLAGVGIEISQNQETGEIFASDIQENSPAMAAGIREGDVFVSVDGTSFDTPSGSSQQSSFSSTPDDVAVLLRGPPGSKVGVTMKRGGKDGEWLEYILTRQPITINAVKSYLLANEIPGGKVGVIRIKNFSGNTASKVREQYNILRKKGASRFVLDLRGNPGGLLPGGVETASLFLDANLPVVYVVNKSGVVDAQSTLQVGLDLESPLVVFVDSNTASAAEVLTAALQEHHRAIIAGEQTFGKGIVQTVRELSNNQGGVAITVARYETPILRRNINSSGIPVDMKMPVDCPKDDISACLKSSLFQTPPTSQSPP
jgi:carboxyl-terminal processing protease